MLLIDNYDSFTYNLVQAFAAKGAEVIMTRSALMRLCSSNPRTL